MDDTMGNADAGAATESHVETQANEAPDSREPAGSGSARDAIDRAFASLEQGDTQEADAAAAAPAQKAERDRNPDGTFAPKKDMAQADPAKAEATATEAPKADAAADTAADDAPARFSADAKAAWKDAPPAIKGEVKRALSELEGGLNQYRERLAPYQGLEQFAQLASQGGKNLATVMQNYYGAEQMLRQNPAQGVAHILSNLGISPQEVAAAILQVEPNQQAAQSDRTIYELRQQVQQLQQQVGTVAQTFEQQQAAEAMLMIEQFKANKPRFDELREDMQFFVAHGKASTLDEAYALAERLNPAPQVTPPPASAPATAAPSPIPAAQTRKAALSVTGAPASGSNPTTRKAPSSARGAIDNAFASLGLA